MSLKALNVYDIYNTVNPDEPIPFSDPRYVDLSPARGGRSVAAIAERRIRYTKAPNYQRILVTGRRGSGKSTELRGLQEQLEQAGFLVAYLDVEQTLTLVDIEYLDILVAIAQTLNELGEKHDLALNPGLLADIGEWFAEIVLTSEEREATAIEVGSEAGIGFEVPLLSKIIASVTSKIRSDTVNRREVRRKLEPRLPELIERLNLLVDNVTQKARERGFGGLVIIVDSLEKMMLKYLDDRGLTNHALLFVEHAEQLKSFNCHTVYTVPVSLLNDRNLGTAFDIFLIPMVKINTRDGLPYQKGRDLLYEVVFRRVDVPLVFSDSGLVYRLIEHSGGVMRDLMRLLIFSADYTPEGAKITEKEVEQAIQNLVRDYGRLIHAKDLELLHRVDANPYIPASADLDRLMYNRLVLPYRNDDEWVALHPAVKQTPVFRTFAQRRGMEQR